jgi:hypothetical protein
MVATHSTSVSSSAFDNHMEANLGQYVEVNMDISSSLGVGMDNGHRSGSLPPNANLAKAHFSDIVKNVMHSPRLLIQKAPTIIIPMVDDIAFQETFYHTNGLICHFKSPRPRLVDMHKCISNS